MRLAFILKKELAKMFMEITDEECGECHDAFYEIIGGAQKLAIDVEKKFGTRRKALDQKHDQLYTEENQTPVGDEVDKLELEISEYEIPREDKLINDFCKNIKKAILKRNLYLDI